jgi:hypothetical protein
MPGHSPPARRFLAAVLTYPPRAILNTLMSLAVIALERRTRKALRSAEVPNGSA